MAYQTGLFPTKWFDSQDVETTIQNGQRIYGHILLYLSNHKVYCYNMPCALPINNSQFSIQKESIFFCFVSSQMYILNYNLHLSLHFQPIIFSYFKINSRCMPNLDGIKHWKLWMESLLLLLIILLVLVLECSSFWNKIQH